ncbi:hypothetical protein LTR37_000405 [Vermiconidia calcicola]|uniref:Uncharacterized protein n=1 Tax=Vermiconidia calcicola TaxID=1690605 RepID=A0ACC3NYQ9_9PEZI|nr:hypothetical protein LTR37_000405 [Vermiconidia calcicola]
MASPMYGAKRHHHHGVKFAQNYTDLSRQDISSLTKILSHAPKRPRSVNGASYQNMVRDLITKLPSHLRNKLPWVSTLCSLHNKMNPLPVVSIFDALKHEIDGSTAEIWIPLRDQGKMNNDQAEMLTVLQDVSSLWLRPTPVNRSEKKRPAYEYCSNRCAGCMLARIGGDVKAVTALGAFLIGRLDAKIWQRSKRILFVEAWIRNAVPDAEEEDAVISMWQLGIELGRVRKAAVVEDRPYVAEFVEQARAERSPSRKSPSQDEKAQATGSIRTSQVQNSRVDEWLEEVTVDDLFNDEGEQPPLGEGLRISSSPSPAGFVHGPASVVRDRPYGELPYTASSIYSNHSGGLKETVSPNRSARSSWEYPSSHDTESELLGLYQHSTVQGSRM